MTTNEEIKKLAYEYVRLNGISESEAYYENKRNIELDDIFSILQWLSKDYCIVPKSKVINYYSGVQKQINTPCCDPRDAYENQDARSQKLVLENLFSKELFE